MVTWIKKPIPLTIALCLFLVLLYALISAWRALQGLPDINQLSKCIKTSMNNVNLCDSSPNYVKISDISEYLIQATIIAEDAAFFSHNGFDWDEIKLTIETNLKRGKYARGGSTITQQLAKNVFLTPDKSLTRKFKEAYLAAQLEERYSKKFLLEKYLNVVELGPKIFGVKAAAEHYFDKSVSDLNFLEAAFLAYLLPNPKKYSHVFITGELTPFARKRILSICRKLNLFNRISADQYQLAGSLIDMFPWKELSLEDQLRLSGVFLQPSPEEGTGEIDRSDHQQEQHYEM